LLFIPLNSIRNHANKRRATPSQLNVVVDPEGQWVGDKMVDRYRFVLTDGEDRIHLITRFHLAKMFADWVGYRNTGKKRSFWGATLKLIGGAVLLLFILVALFSAAAVRDVPPWVPVLVLFLVGISMLFASIRWRYTVFILTSQNVRKVFEPPLLLTPFMKGDQPVAALIKVDTWEMKQTSFANFTSLDYATVSIDTPSERDEPFNNMHFMPDPDWVVKNIGTRVEEARQRNLQVAAVAD
jgi:hypothetical protein